MQVVTEAGQCPPGGRSLSISRDLGAEQREYDKNDQHQTKTAAELSPSIPAAPIVATFAKQKDQPLIIYLLFNQVRRLLRCVLELRQHFEPFLGAARQDHLFFGELQRVIRDNNQVSAHAQEAADREHGEWPLAV